MKEIHIPALFQGEIKVLIPENTPEELQLPLATKIAGARIIAEETSDGPEDQICGELQDEFPQVPEETIENLWDESKMDGVNGTWTFPGENNDEITKLLIQMIQTEGNITMNKGMAWFPDGSQVDVSQLVGALIDPAMDHEG